MESDVLKQVEALFSVIDSLPENLREDALKKIHSRLGPAQKKQKNSTKDIKKEPKIAIEISKAQDEERTEEEQLIKLCESDGIKILHCYSESAETPPNVRKKRAKKSCDVLNVQSKVNVEGPEESTSSKGTQRSKRKRRIPKRFLDGEEIDESHILSSSDTSEKTVEVEEEQQTTKETPLIHVFKVPSGVKPNAIIQDLTEATDAGDVKRIRGQRTVYGCTQCNRKFHSRSMVLVHMRVHTGERPHKCHLCDRTFTQRGALNIHVKRHEGKFSFTCEFCDYKSIAKVDMMRHVARHTGEKNYSCEHCGKGFITDCSLKDHLKHIHERLIKYECSLCTFSSHRPDNLKRHMIVKHSNKEYIQCPVCNKFIKQKGTFITHLRTHTGERPHACPICEKQFKSQSQVAAHLRTHKEGLFQCNDCQRRFKTRFHLKRHSLVHTGEKPFNCMYCKYSCNVKGNINKHVKLVHGFKDFSFRTVNKEAGNLELEENEAQVVQEKGKVIAEEFLTKLSTRKDENLTVEELQRAMELKKTEDNKKWENFKSKRNKVAGSNGQKAKQKNRMPLLKKSLELGYVDEETVAMTFLKDFNMALNCEVEEEESELKIEENIAEDQEIGEETLTVVMDGNEENEDSKETTIMMVTPSDSYICLQQPGLDGEITVPLSYDNDDDQLAANTTTVYLIQCEPES